MKNSDTFSILFFTCINCTFNSILIKNTLLISGSDPSGAGLLVFNCTGTLNNITSTENKFNSFKGSIGGIVGLMNDGSLSNCKSFDNEFNVSSSSQTFVGAISAKATQ